MSEISRAELYKNFIMVHASGNRKRICININNIDFFRECEIVVNGKIVYVEETMEEIDKLISGKIRVI